MKHEKYELWIKNNVFNPYGKCEKYTKLMQKEFPELLRIRGHYDCPICGKREHWWLTLKEIIIDPTVKQFPSGGIGIYIPFEEGSPEPTGKCLHCGNYVYNYKLFCCDECSKDGMKYYNKNL